MAKEKTPKKKTKTKTATKRNGIPNGATIKLLKKGNQRRAGTAAYRKFTLYEDGMTVAEYIAAGKKAGIRTSRGNVRADMARGNVALEMPKAQK